MANLKVYLDTNMILDVFINHARALKKKEDVLLPKKYEFMLAHKERVDFVTSFITKAEVARELVSGFGLSHGEIETLWHTFTQSLGCVCIDSFTFDAAIADVASRTHLKLRTLFNLMHLYIAVHEQCYFVSGDKDLIRKIKSLNIYENVIDYKGLRNIIEGDV